MIFLHFYLYFSYFQFFRLWNNFLIFLDFWKNFVSPFILIFLNLFSSCCWLIRVFFFVLISLQLYVYLLGVLRFSCFPFFLIFWLIIFVYCLAFVFYFYLYYFPCGDRTSGCSLWYQIKRYYRGKKVVVKISKCWSQKHKIKMEGKPFTWNWTWSTLKCRFLGLFLIHQHSFFNLERGVKEWSVMKIRKRILDYLFAFFPYYI